MASATGLGVTLGEPGEDISIANGWTERREEVGTEYTCFSQTLNFTKAGNIPIIPLQIPISLETVRYKPSTSILLLPIAPETPATHGTKLNGPGNIWT